MRKFIYLLIFVCAAVGFIVLMKPTALSWVIARFTSYSVLDRLVQYQDSVRVRLYPFFEQAGVAYPPKKVVLAFFKDTKTLNSFAADNLDVLRFVKTYPVHDSWQPGFDWLSCHW